MKRVLLLGFVLLAAGSAVACGGKTFPSLCTGDVSAPAACNQTCDPAPGAPKSCPIGFHCSADGKCDSVCTLTQDQCGNDYFCTLDGHCQANDDPGGGGGGDGDACPGVHVAATKTTPTVQLLLDQSGSMTAAYPGGTNSPNRWDSMVKALVDDNTGVVKRLADRVVFGATLFTARAPMDTHTPQGVCPVLTPATFQPRVINNFNAIAQLLNGADPIDETPTPESIDAVVKDFKDHPPMTGSPPILVLATDGLPDTCQDANPDGAAAQEMANATTVAAAQRAYAAGVKLFYLFVGSAGSAAVHAQKMANAGAGIDPNVTDASKAKFYEAIDPAQLSAAFDEIVGGVLSCDLRLSGIIDPSDAQTGIVTVNGMTLTYGTEWNIGPDGITMHLLGGACDMVKNNPNSTVDAVFACGTVIF